MLTVIDSGTRITRAQKELRKIIASAATEHDADFIVGYPSGSGPADTYWLGGHDIWVGFPIADRVDLHERLAVDLDRSGARADAATVRAALRGAEGALPDAVETWGVIARVVAGIESGSEEPSNEKVAYEYTTLGTRAGRTLLAELYPVPKPRLDAWSDEHSNLCGYPSHSRWYSGFWPRRVARGACRQSALRREVIEPLAPGAVVVQYTRGTRNEFWDRFDHLVSADQWRPVGRDRRGRIEMGIDVAVDQSRGLYLARTSAFARRTWSDDLTRTLSRALLELRDRVPLE